MAFPQDDLHEDEEIVVNTRPHWLWAFRSMVLIAISILLLAGAVVAAATAAAAGLRLAALVGCAGIVSLSLLVIGVRQILSWRYVYYVVTDHRLILRVGILRRYKRDIPLRRVQDIHLDQSIIARMVRAGHLRIESAGNESGIQLGWMPDADGTRRTISQLARAIRGEEEGV